jgi:predicted nucleic acid-binding Zn ribbon protein
MPTYCTVCDSCGARAEITKPMNAAFPPCACGASVSVDFAAQGPPMNGNREFHGRRRESLEEFWGKHDAAGIAKELGKSGKCVQPDGTVSFKDRAEQRQYKTDKAAMLQRFKEKAERRKQRKAQMEPPKLAESAT